MKNKKPTTPMITLNTTRLDLAKVAIVWARLACVRVKASKQACCPVKCELNHGLEFLEYHREGK